jgi:hypothetical protein
MNIIENLKDLGYGAKIFFSYMAGIAIPILLMFGIAALPTPWCVIGLCIYFVIVLAFFGRILRRG